jgi:hypothetical protein
MISPIWVFDALDELGLRFEPRTTARGVPYAGLRMLAPGGPVPLTIISIDDALRITAHAAPRASREPLRRLTERMPLARAYAEEGGTDVALGVYAGDPPLPAGLLRQLIEHTIDSFLAVRDDAPAPKLPVIPGLRAPVVAEPATDGVRLKSRIKDGWLIVDGSAESPLATVPGDDDDILDRLQRWTVAGRFLLGADGMLSAQVATPLLTADIDGRIAWTFDQARVMLQTAYRHLRGGV